MELKPPESRTTKNGVNTMSFGDDTLDPGNVDVKRCNLDVGILDTTIDEWQAEMERFVPRNVPGKTISELSRELDIPDSTMRNRIQILIQEGRCIRRYGIRKDDLGRDYQVSLYQLITIEKEKK